VGHRIVGDYHKVEVALEKNELRGAGGVLRKKGLGLQGSGDPRKCVLSGIGVIRTKGGGTLGYLHGEKG